MMSQIPAQVSGRFSNVQRNIVGIRSPTNVQLGNALMNSTPRGVAPKAPIQYTAPRGTAPQVIPNQLSPMPSQYTTPRGAVPRGAHPKAIQNQLNPAQNTNQFNPALFPQNNIQQQMNQPRAFAPQMQMPINQGLPPRVQSGMNFNANTSGNLRPPPMAMQNQLYRPQSPVVNSGVVPQYNNNQPSTNLTPQQMLMIK